MIFCGQCGLQLPPGTARCQRCGTLVESDMALDSSASGVNVPSMVDPRPFAPGQPSLPGTQHPGGPSRTQHPVGAFPAPNPQQLILRGGANSDFAPQSASDATSAMTAPFAPGVPQTQQRGVSYAGPQTGYYAPQQTAAPGSYAGFTPGPGGYQQFPGQRDASRASQRAKGRITGLILILLGLLLILGSMVSLFAINRNSGTANNGTGNQNTAVATTTVVGQTTPSPSVSPSVVPTPPPQAQALIQQYYTFINSKNYQSAYNLWKEGSRKQGFTAFRNGFKNTVESTVSFDDISMQTDKTAKVTVTVRALEKSGKNNQQHTYTGFYLVEEQANGSWLIIDAELNEVQ